VAPYQPTARSRAGCGKVARMIDRTWGSIAAAASPWASLAPMRAPAAGAIPAATEATA
jgi:hypothetical protein